MKQITIIKKEHIRCICVNGEEMCWLRPIRNAVKEGCDSRDKYYVHNITNSFNVKIYLNTARSLKEVVKYLEKKINTNQN
jgi:hypothetical protein